MRGFCSLRYFVRLSLIWRYQRLTLSHYAFSQRRTLPCLSCFEVYRPSSFPPVALVLQTPILHLFCSWPTPGLVCPTCLSYSISPQRQCYGVTTFLGSTFKSQGVRNHHHFNNLDGARDFVICFDRWFYNSLATKADLSFFKIGIDHSD